MTTIPPDNSAGEQKVAKQNSQKGKNNYFLNFITPFVYNRRYGRTHQLLRQPCLSFTQTVYNGGFENRTVSLLSVYGIQSYNEKRSRYERLSVSMQ